ncbi:TPA: putative holin [Pseudomonas aeruginosa]
MSEPSSAASAASAMAGVGLAMYLPGIDGNALLGGFGGAIFFVVFARDYNALTRLGYLLVSWVGGYYAATEAVGRGATQFSGLPALVTAALIVTILIGVLDWMIGGRAPAWLQIVLQRIVGMIGGRKDG